MASPYLVPVAQLLRDVPSVVEVDFEAPFDEAHEFAPRGPAETDVDPDSLVRVQIRLSSYLGDYTPRGPCRRLGTGSVGAARYRRTASARSR